HTSRGLHLPTVGWGTPAITGEDIAHAGGMSGAAGWRWGPRVASWGPRVNLWVVGPATDGTPGRGMPSERLQLPRQRGHHPHDPGADESDGDGGEEEARD